MAESEVVSLIDLVCKGEGRRSPRTVSFRNSGHSYCLYRRGGTIVLPRSAFLDEHQLVTTEEHRLLVLHETTHWLVGEIGHASPFYATLFRLCEQYGVDLAMAYEDEVDYRPRYARLGFNEYTRAKKKPPA
jgi:hypothetical protein